MSEARLDIRSRLVVIAACLAAVFTAFEIRTPVITAGPVGFTTSEAAAGLLIFTSLIYAVSNLSWYLSRRKLDVAVILFLFVNFLSAALVAEDKPGALKFSLRMTYAALVYLAVSRLPARSRGHLWIAGSIAAALVIVTVVGLMEDLIPSAQWPSILEPFQEGIITFGAFYNIRVASTLPFPTVLSMYLELTLPVALAFGLWFAGRAREKSRRLLIEAAVVVLLTGVMMLQIFTYTRTALVSTPVAFLGGAALAAVFGYGRRVWGFLILGAVVLAVTLGGLTLFSDKMASRLDVSWQAQRYGAEYTLRNMPTDLSLGQVGTARMHIRNLGSITWEAEGDDAVEGSYRWVNYPEKEIQQDIQYIVTKLPHSVPPGGEVDLVLDFKTPDHDGKYVFLLELAQKHVGLFSTAGVAPAVVPLEFVGGRSHLWVTSEPPASFEAGEPDVASVSRVQLWRAAYRAWRANPVLGLGPDQFRKRYNDYSPELPHDERVRAHNILLEAAATTGVIGLAVMVFMLIRVFTEQFRLVRNRRQGLGARLVSLALIVAFTSYVFHGILDCFLWQTGVAFLFFIYLGLTSWLQYASEGEPADE